MATSEIEGTEVIATRQLLRAPRCYVCHRTDGLRCTAPGWGGVWACDDCRSQ